MAKDMLLWLFLGNAVFVVVNGLSLPLTTPGPQTCVDPQYGTTHEDGESWHPDPCTWCDCTDGEAQCYMAGYVIPRCVDSVQNPDECGPSCPNGENCGLGSIIIPNGEKVTTDSGSECWCEEISDYYGELVAVCSPPPTTMQTPSPYCEDPTGRFTEYKEGDSWQPDPCTWCYCENGQVMCAVADCLLPNCVDPTRDPTQCCETCPNGENCKLGSIIIPRYEDYILENGERCFCRETGDLWGGLEAYCVPPSTTPPVNCPDESWQPDPCTWCFCEDGEPQCAVASCAPPNCVDSVQHASQCCRTCPNGPNCQYDNEIISLGETIILDDERSCFCEGESWGPLEAVCVSPPSPPSTTSTATTTTSIEVTDTTSLSPREARQQAKEEARQAKAEEHQAKKEEAQQARDEARQAKAEERQDRKEEAQQAREEARQAKAEERQAKKEEAQQAREEARQAKAQERQAKKEERQAAREANR